MRARPKSQTSAPASTTQAIPPPLSAPADALGWVSSVGGAREYLNGWVCALESCKRFAYILAHTFDFPAVVDSVAAARKRGV